MKDHGLSHELILTFDSRLFPDESRITIRGKIAFYEQAFPVVRAAGAENLSIMGVCEM